MPNPRNPGNPNDPRSQQYGWAYGGGQPAQNSGPEPTNVMPTVRRPQAGSPPPAPPRGGYDRPLPQPGEIAPTPGQGGYGNQGYGQGGYNQGYNQGWSQPSEYGGNGGYGGPGDGYGDGYGGGRGGRQPRPKKRHPFRKFLIIVMIPILILVGSVAWIGISAWNKVDKVAYEPTAGERPADQTGTT